MSIPSLPKWLGILPSLWLALMVWQSTGIAGTGSPPWTLEAFANPSREFRPRLFWRVFGPSWTESEIDWQLKLMRDAHVGGVTAFFMYPVEVEGSQVHHQRFLSPEFLERLGYAARRAKAEGLRFSVAGGTGWPFGGPTVGAGDAALQLRRIDLSNGLPQLAPGEIILSTVGGEPPGAGGAFAFLTGPTGMRVKRPALGAEGLVLNHYDAAAASRYVAQVIEPMVRAAPGLIESIFCDSLELYHANWTRDLPTEFLRRRGHALLPLLPEVFSSSATVGSEARFEFWETLAELTEERFARTTAEAVHRLGVRFEMEAYGTPPNPLTTARYIDLPTGEQYEWKGFSLSRWAASGAHLAGKPLIGAEAWTWLGLPNRLGDSLSDLKLASDLHFLAGVNDLTGVDFAYSPRSAGSPGWLPYYGPVLNQNNPQWPWFHLLADYLSRCQWMLRMGRPAARVAVYLPVEDAFAAGPADQMLLDFAVRDRLSTGPRTDEFGLAPALSHESEILHTLLTQGFNFDGIDFFAMNRLVQVHSGQMVAGDGVYSILVLPRLEGIELNAAEKIVAFCRSGGTVISVGPPPRRGYGTNADIGRSRLESMVKEVFGPTPSAPIRHRCGRGTGIITDNLAMALHGLTPELTLMPPQPEVGFTHRNDGRRDIYFLVNTAGAPTKFTVRLPRHSTPLELWDPLSGGVRRVPSAATAEGIETEVSLAPRGSIFVVANDPSRRGRPAAGLATGGNPGNSPGDWNVRELQLDWWVSFHGPDAPPPRRVARLESWSTWPDAKFFSGEAVYQADLVWTNEVTQSISLDLGDVQTVASVRCNDVEVGSAWMPPFTVQLAPQLRRGTNHLEIRCANLLINRYLGQPSPDLGPLRAAYGNRFPDPEEKQFVKEPPAAGLLGPLRLWIQEEIPANGRRNADRRGG